MSKRELIVTPHHDGRARMVAVDGPLPDGRFRIAIDGRLRDVDAREVRPGTWSLVFDGRSVVVDLDRRPSAVGAVIASVGTGEFVLEIEGALQQTVTATRKSSHSGETLRAPIAGKVVKINIAIGEVVARNTPVVAIEAMKMENELVCERGGMVTAIHKQVGQAVETGDLLVELE